MFCKSPLRLAIAAILAVPVAAQAEIEVSAELKNETAVYARGGQVTGEAKSTLDNGDHDAGSLMKFENSARIFLNGDVGESSSWHAEIRPVIDTEGTTADYKYHRSYTQNDYLRELYVDTSLGGWDLRLGKQQVVWGTADGIKLLDIINPTDFRELNQNAFEDSRIPVWMINAERNIGERGNIQVIVSQAETNKVAGLWTQDDNATRSTVAAGASPTGLVFTGNGQINGQDTGHPFIMRGVDVITGGVNGFFNMGAAFGGVINTFGGFNPLALNFLNPGGVFNPAAGTPEAVTVDGFVNTPAAFLPAACGGFGAGANGAVCLEAFTEATNMNITNLIDVNPAAATVGASGWNVTKPNSAWEHFPNATFATFNSMLGMTTRYERAYDDDDVPSDANFGARFRSYLDSGLNYSVNYFYGYDANPHVNMHWEDPRTGQKLVVDKFTTAIGTQVIQIRNPATGQLYGGNADFSDSATGYAGGPAPTDVTPANNGGAAVLVFEEDRNRIHNLGGSFDFATEAGDIPLVIRGEFLYQKDVMQPVVNRGALANGDLVGALKSEEHDFFKYVVGVDATVMTNLLVSGQFIQFRNLDFKDKDCSFTTQGGAVASCATYTGDPAVMSVTNGLKKGYKNKEFYSLFLSKPFGENQLGRWNNILIFEEGGGYWNRLDAEYSLSDALIISGEINLYFGDEETLFGQFENSSNVQVGLKYIID
ncbi:MAG: RNA polymerase-associated protein rapA [Gammaproteobacteria bacterium]|nr:RNA polymerase-associated protein rapA [Gammaproteobacteria bacterium]